MAHERAAARCFPAFRAFQQFVLLAIHHSWVGRGAALPTWLVVFSVDSFVPTEGQRQLPLIDERESVRHQQRLSVALFLGAAWLIAKKLSRCRQFVIGRPSAKQHQVQTLNLA